MRPLLLAILAVGLAAAPAGAQEVKAGTLQISTPWARATPKGATVGGAYMKITNNGSEPDRLIGGSSPVAGKFEIHGMSMQGDVMKMRPLQNGIEIKPGQTVELKPGGSHVMLVGLKRPLVKGEEVKATLEFQKAGKVDVSYAVSSIGAQSSEGVSAPGLMMNQMDHIKH